MRKRIVEQNSEGSSAAVDQEWLDLEQLVQVELSSEDAGHPIESALTSGTGPGWRARQPGKQTIRLLFDQPRRISRIQLLFEEDRAARTQEFTLCWSADGQAPCREIVRQQYNFSPPNSVSQLEDYAVDLEGLRVLELTIIPDISGGEARASLARLRLA